MSAEEKKFYVTTPIYYVNARPHIGHAYTTIVADVLARRHRLLGEDTFFLTGTDEHGQKIERSAAAAGVAPQQFADEVSGEFRRLWERMGLLNDSFSKDDPLFQRRYIRTTDECHKRGVQKLFTELYERGFIYLSTYTGSYCVSDEAFVDAPAGTPCPECGRTLETVTEENFFFKLSEFQQPLIELIEGDEDSTLTISPKERKNEVLSFLRGNVKAILDEHVIREIQSEVSSLKNNLDEEDEVAAGPDNLHLEEMLVESGELARNERGFVYVPGTLKDLSISRSSFTWGIPVPEEVQRQSGAKHRHVIYVWLDALANYMTAVGYGSKDTKDIAEFKRYWPANLHLVGKEIIRFHCVYWPAFLLALNPKLQHDSKEKPPQLSFEEHREWAADWLPKAVTAHGWLLFDNAKMSKSKGNIVRTETILEAFGEHVYAKQFPESTKRERDLFAADVLRYFLLREIPFGQDGSFSFEAMVTRYNADLANGYGNLVSRTLKLIEQYFGSLIPPHEEWGKTRILFDVPSFSQLQPEHNMVEVDDAELAAPCAAMRRFIDEAFPLLAFSRAANDNEMSARLGVLDLISQLITLADALMTRTAPWKALKAEDDSAKAQAADAIYQVCEAVRHITASLHPFLPFATAKVWGQLGLGDIEEAAKRGELKNLQWGGLKPGTKLGELAPIFPRAPKELVDIMAELEEKSATTTQGSQPAAEQQAQPQLEPNPPGGAPALVPPTEETVKSTQINIEDFAKVELRVAQIVVAERIPKADKLLRLEVDLGYERRQILSGIAEWYAPEDLVGRRIVVVTNLAPRKMRGLESHGMLLAASEGEGGKPVLATFGEEIALGARLK